MASLDASAQGAAAPKQFIYVLRLVPRLHDAAAWTARDNDSVSAHFKRLQAATQEGRVILAGRTDEPLNRTFGIVIFEARSEAEARAFMEADPTVQDGVMVAELHPYSVALLRK
ncbi:MAG: hypothetical protein EKK53_14035 [Burkholderiales bacterium]|nr:MAG: hypothetical protein EKK53_14035 [Burkholderiales bacterium]